MLIFARDESTTTKTNPVFSEPASSPDLSSSRAFSSGQIANLTAAPPRLMKSASY